MRHAVASVDIICDFLVILRSRSFSFSFSFSSCSYSCCCSVWAVHSSTYFEYLDVELCSTLCTCSPHPVHRSSFLFFSLSDLLCSLRRSKTLKRDRCKSIHWYAMSFDKYTHFNALTKQFKQFVVISLLVDFSFFLFSCSFYMKNYKYTSSLLFNLTQQQHVVHFTF